MEYSWLQLFLSCNLSVYFSDLLTDLFVKDQVLLFWSSAAEGFKHFAYEIFQGACRNFRIFFLYFIWNALLRCYHISSFSNLLSFYVMRFRRLFEYKGLYKIVRGPAFIFYIVFLTKHCNDSFKTQCMVNCSICSLLFYTIHFKCFVCSADIH